MSLLQQLLEMDGVTSAASVASTQGSLFGGGVITRVPSKKKKKKVKLSEISNPDDTFDHEDVISKLKAAEIKTKKNDDTVCFGMEDEDGKIIRVFIKSDQAEDFDIALGNLLSKEYDQEDDDMPNSYDLAEILYNLSSKFDIIDVDWGEIEPDQENEEQAVDMDTDSGEETAKDTNDLDSLVSNETGEGGESGEDTTATGEEGEGDTSDDMLAGEESSGDDSSSALQQAIDALKADSDARKAEAQARAAEAKAKTAKYTAQASEQKVQQEQDVLDMEAYYDDKKEEEEETKRLAKLAKYRHDKSRDSAMDESTNMASNYILELLKMNK